MTVSDSIQKFCLFALLSCMCFQSQLTAAEGVLAADQKLDIFLLIGQSNMAGRGKIEAEDKVPDPRVWTFNKEREWAPAVDPLHWDKPKIAGVGMGLTFAKTLAAQDPKRFIGLVPCAVGGTSIDQWKKGGALYTDAMTRIHAALKHGKLAGILWHQGESDVSKLDTYTDKLIQLVKDLREELKSPEVPFIAGQLGEFHAKKSPGTIKFNELIMDMPKKITNMACASSKDLASIGDDTHFDAKGQRELGKRYAEAYLKLSHSTAKP